MMAGCEKNMLGIPNKKKEVKHADDPFISLEGCSGARTGGCLRDVGGFLGVRNAAGILQTDGRGGKRIPGHRPDCAGSAWRDHRNRFRDPLGRQEVRRYSLSRLGTGTGKGRNLNRCEEVKYEPHSELQGQGRSRARARVGVRAVGGVLGIRDATGILQIDGQRQNGIPGDRADCAGSTRRDHRHRLRHSLGGPQVWRNLLALATCLVLLGALLAPSKADGFVGESTVLKPGGTDLTGPAKSIIENPSFLTENVGEAGASAGTAESSAAAGVFEGAGLLPALGSVLSFGVGTVIGSEICHVIGIEGCWYFGSNGADPAAPPETYAWHFQAAKCEGCSTPIPGYTWYLEKGSSAYIGAVHGYSSFTEESKCSPAINAPSGTDSAAVAPKLENICGFSAEKHIEAQRATPLRYSMSNRNLTYHATDEPGIGNYAYTAPGNWSEKLAAQIKGQTGNPAAHVGEKIASKIGGSGVANPYAGVSVPSCEGATSAGCVKTLEELGLAAEPKYLGWEVAYIPDVNLEEPVLSLEAQAEKVQSLSPKPGEKVVKGSKVIVTSNPKEEDMPLIVPEDPAPGESPDQWNEKRLAPQKPGWTVVPHTLSETAQDPHYDPGTVVRPEVEPGTRIDPDTEPTIDVRTNPEDAPPAVPLGFTPPSLHAIDLSPFTEIHTGCNSFPFGAFCWFGEALTNFGSEGTCPSLGIPVGSAVGKDWEVGVDFCEYESAMSVWRSVFIFFATIGIVMAFAMRSMGLGSGVSDD